MSPLPIRPRFAGMSVLVLALAVLSACGPRVPNPAEETPLAPTTAPTRVVTNTVPAPTATTPPEAYPPPTEVPPATATLAGYPGGEDQPTADPNATDTAAPPTNPPAPTATQELVFITYRDFEIVPSQTTARVGQQVIFLIESASGAFHQPFAGASAPFIFEAPPNMGNGVSWPITFNNPQTLTILCGYHSNMTATLVIAP